MEAMQAGCYCDVTEQCYLLFVVGRRNADCGSIRGGWKLAISFGWLACAVYSQACAVHIIGLWTELYSGLQSNLCYLHSLKETDLRPNTLIAGLLQTKLCACRTHSLQWRPNMLLTACVYCKWEPEEDRDLWCSNTDYHNRDDIRHTFSAYIIDSRDFKYSYLTHSFSKVYFLLLT